MLSSRAFTAVGLPIMGRDSTPEELFNLSDLRVELLQSGARDLLMFLSNEKQQMLRYARHDCYVLSLLDCRGQSRSSEDVSLHPA